MNYKNPFNNNIQNNFNYNSYFQKETDKENFFNLYDSDNEQKDKDNFQNKEFEIIHNYYESKIKPFNSSKNYISCSTDVIPLNEEISSKLGIPISLSLTPIINSENNIKLPFIDYGTNNIPRCKNPDCKAFLNPFITLLENQEKWICNFCDKENDIEEYFYYDLSKEEEISDINNKPELCCGSYEFEANKFYYNKNKCPTRAFFMFLFETSLSSINSGFLEASIEGLKYAINNNIFFNKDDANISIITYDINVNFYSYGEKFSAPQILTVADEPTFLPTSKINLIFNVEEDKNKILQILDLIQSIFNKNNINLKNHVKDSDKIFSALNSAYLLGKNLGGKILIFSSSNILGKLPKLIGGLNKNATKEQIAYSCHDNKEMEVIGLNLTNDNMSIDLFVTAEININLLTLNQLCEFTNGNLYFYKKFNSDLHYKNIFNQIKKVLSRPIIWEGINKIKFSNNCKINGFITPILIVENELFVFPTADADQNYIFNVGYDKQNENENNLKNKQIDNNINNLAMKKNFIYIQNSLLYSFGNGKRRIRVHNLCLPISNDPKIIYGSMNSEIIANYYIRMTIDKIYKSKTIANSISYTETQFRLFLNKVLHCLKQLPDNLSFLPYYMIGFFKNRLFFPNEIDKKYDIDLSNYLRIKFQKMYIKEALSYIIPMIYNINEIKKENKIGVYDKELGIFNLPNNLPCSKKELKEDGLYLIDIGYLLILYVRKKINKNILRNLFGVDEFNSINTNLNEDNVFEEINFFKERLMNIINYLRDEKSNFQNLIFVYEGTESEKIINSYMIEDNNCKWYPVSYEKYYNKYIEDNSFGY